MAFSLLSKQANSTNRYGSSIYGIQVGTEFKNGVDSSRFIKFLKVV